MQGALLVTLRNSPSGQPIDEGEVRRKFQQFGDVKSVRPADRPDQCYVEFFDIRVCTKRLVIILLRAELCFESPVCGRSSRTATASKSAGWDNRYHARMG